MDRDQEITIHWNILTIKIILIKTQITKPKIDFKIRMIISLIKTTKIQH